MCVILVTKEKKGVFCKLNERVSPITGNQGSLLNLTLLKLDTKLEMLSSNTTITKAHVRLKDFHNVFPQFFYFSPVGENTALTKIRNINFNKAVQDTDIPLEILKDIVDFLRNVFIFNVTSGILIRVCI